MNRRRLAAAGFFSFVIVAVLGVMIYLQAANNQQSVTVFILRHAVLAGAPYSDADVSVVTIRAANGDFNYERRAPGQFQARYSQDLSTNDILRDDDLADVSSQVEVAVTLQAPPPLAAGDRIDIFATLGAGRQARVGQGITVLTAAGDALTILVPLRDEEAWVSLASSSIALHAARATAESPTSLSPLAPADAVSQLCGSSCSVGSTP